MPAVRTFPAFQSAVQEFESVPLEVRYEPDAEGLVRQSFEASGILLVGECHGVAENALMIRALVERFEVDTIALEWPGELSPVLERFVRTGVLSNDRLLWLGDGRVTAGHLATLRHLARDGIALAMIDRGVRSAGMSWSERDRDMAGRVLEVAAEAERVLVVAGSAHTKLIDTHLGTPMGARIARVEHQVLEIQIDYGSGTLFNFRDQSFADRFGGESDTRLCAADGLVTLRIPRASAAVVAFDHGRSLWSDGCSRASLA